MIQELEKFKDYVPYLDQLRKKIFWSIGIFVITGILGIFFSNNIMLFFLKLFNFSGVNVVATSPGQLINLSIYTGLIVGLMCLLPFLFYQLISFFRPAFTKKEYKLIKKILPISLGLFLLGAVFGAWITQFVITIYSNFSASFNISNIWDIQKFFSQVIVTALLTGIIFEVPLLLTILMRLGIMKRRFLVSKRKYVYAIIVIIAVLLPPTDILSLTLITIPLFFLFEITLLLNQGY
jgi:sec-independent protein translocase protein TatC